MGKLAESPHKIMVKAVCDIQSQPVYVKGVDPERPAELYGYMYPLNRTYNFGASVTF